MSADLPVPASSSPETLRISSRKTGRYAESFEGEVGFLALRPPAPTDPELPEPDARHPRAGVRVRRRRRLQLIAATQHGLFTSRQAASAGLDRRARHHHLTYGNWRRTEAPGVMRLSGWPADPAERCRAWLLWADSGAALTSWTALELLGCTVAGPRTPVCLAVPEPATYEGVRRLRAARRVLAQLAAGDPNAPKVHPSGVVHGPPAELHRLPMGGTTLEVEGMAVRSGAEAMCAAVSAFDGGRASCALTLDLMDELIAAGRLDQWTLARTAVAMGVTAVRDHLWPRFSSPADRATGVQ